MLLGLDFHNIEPLCQAKQANSYLNLLKTHKFQRRLKNNLLQAPRKLLAIKLAIQVGI